MIPTVTPHKRGVCSTTFEQNTAGSIWVVDYGRMGIDRLVLVLVLAVEAGIISLLLLLVLIKFLR